MDRSFGPGDVQRMSAGSGVRHSEFNPSSSEPVHFLQIWIKPDVKGIQPSYEEKHFPSAAKRGQLRLIASPDGAQGSVMIHQNAKLYAGLFDGEERAALALAPTRRGYVHLVRGEARVNGVALGGGDALELTDTRDVVIDGGRKAEVLVFDLPRLREVTGGKSSERRRVRPSAYCRRGLGRTIWRHRCRRTTKSRSAVRLPMPRTQGSAH